jgi:hypothetical protein
LPGSSGATGGCGTITPRGCGSSPRRSLPLVEEALTFALDAPPVRLGVLADEIDRGPHFDDHTR